MRENLKCPACKQRTMHPVLVRNAKSRYCKKYICSPCGLREAFQGFFWDKQRPAIEKIIKKLKTQHGGAN